MSKDIFAKEVACNNIAYHSRYIAPAGPKLLAYLKQVIIDRKARSEKWISTSVPQSKWSSPSAKFSSAEYHTNNFLSPVLFEETATLIPKDAIAIEIAPHGLLQAILRRSMPSTVTNAPLMLREYKDNSRFFLRALGKLYNSGVQSQLAKLYPRIDYPVSCGTPMISPLINGFSNLVHCEPELTWEVPKEWTMQEAATVPCVYATCYYALYISGKIKKGDAVLIHAGSGGVGQAAIRLALYEGCEVFTTVGTPEKRRFIRETFPSIDDEHIGDSRSTSFEQMVLEETNGRGVGIVLNSLTEDMLQPSLRCLTPKRRFLEIGKFDAAANNSIGMQLFLKEVSLYGIMLDHMVKIKTEDKFILHRVLSEGILKGAVKPLINTVYKRDEIELALRYMAAGKHIGKVRLIDGLKDCEFLLMSAKKKAPVDGIFNVAVVLKNNICTKQTPESFEESFKPKAWATKRLDEVSRKLCPMLRHFVVFSSISCGGGNAKQTNYRVSNSVMERIREKRVEEGFPGLAIQWGTVGQVGLLADLEENDKTIVIGGTLQQSIFSCLKVLDELLLQQEVPIVGSMVVAEKRTGRNDPNSIVNTVMNIMGKDI
ncbi:hypothetical protein KM043_017915 [Ampulex compressa]|nr:hypothetical protein KM043_017915 [Ampulex compressa]